MIAGIPAWKIEEWKAFYELEPDDAHRIDYGLAHVVKAVTRSDKSIHDLKVMFGDDPRPAPPEAPPKQSLELQERLLDTWISGSNSFLRSKGVH